MTERACVGIDYGQLELRAVINRDGIPNAIPVAQGHEIPRVVFDPQRRTSPFGVGFVGILQSVGTGLTFLNAGMHDVVEVFVERHLTTLRERIQALTGAEPGPTALAIPTSLTQSRRATLLECAKLAGFENVTLIDRSLAAALAMRKDRDQSATYVMFDLDYGDCEYALTRIARGRCWTVGSAVLEGISGERLTRAVMEDLVQALRQQGISLALDQFSGSAWIDLRTIAETVREELTRHAFVTVRVNPNLTGTAGIVRLRMEFAGFAEYVRSLLRPGVDEIRQLLDQNGLEHANVDGVLLLGYAARSSPVRDVMLEAFPERVLLTDEDVLATGALAYACDAAGVTLNVHGANAPTNTFTARQIPPDTANMITARESTNGGARFSSVTDVLSLKVPAAQPPAADSTPPDRIRLARRLMDQGMRDEAEALLDTLAVEMAGIKEQLRQQAPPRAQQLLYQAQAMLIDQRFLEAVRLSHEAYALAPTDPTIFTTMMRLHADAGVAMNRVEQYDAALQILNCAHGHDQTNKEIHRALAERHFIHALAMRRLNNYQLACEAAMTALTFDPKHAAANALHIELTTARSPEV
jgi:tetratricopeptide (TPR) repeat protein